MISTFNSNLYDQFTIELQWTTLEPLSLCSFFNNMTRWTFHQINQRIERIRLYWLIHLDVLGIVSMI